MKTFPNASAGIPALATVGESAAARQARAQVLRHAQHSAGVLIVGPDGSGRESLARAIHESGPRRGRPFVVLNCRALSVGRFFDSQVFGHLPGAFAGLKTSSLGLIQAAHSGTLFLRDVTALEFESQEKLFRALQLQMVTPLGGAEAIPVDVRAIGSTWDRDWPRIPAGTPPGNLPELLAENLIEIYCLADRMEDLPALAEEIVRQISARRRLPMRRLCPSATEWIGRYEWPGNLTELRRAIDAAIHTGQEIIDVRTLRSAMKKLHIRAVTTVARSTRRERFFGFGAMRTSSATRCRH